MDNRVHVCESLPECVFFEQCFDSSCIELHITSLKLCPDLPGNYQKLVTHIELPVLYCPFCGARLVVEEEKEE